MHQKVAPGAGRSAFPVTKSSTRGAADAARTSWVAPAIAGSALASNSEREAPSGTDKVVLPVVTSIPACEEQLGHWQTAAAWRIVESIFANSE